MNKCLVVFLLGLCVLHCGARVPFKPREGSLPFLVYFTSRYRGICVGTLVSRTAVLTAAVCVTSPDATKTDRRSINVVIGASYRHPLRGIRVQVLKILIPNITNLPETRGYMMQKSAAILLLRNKIPDILTDVPPRAITIDYKGDLQLSLQEECMVAGWHFFYKGDKIYPVHKFLLQRNIRVQFMNIAKKSLWCEALSIKFRKGLSSLGFHGTIDQGACICVRDGMYGAPLICRGQVVALMLAPDAQWTNCTGHSNIMHLMTSGFLSKFMACASELFEPEFSMDWNVFKKSVYEGYEANGFDYIPEIYDRLYSGSESTSEET